MGEEFKEQEAEEKREKKEIKQGTDTFRKIAQGRLSEITREELNEDEIEIIKNEIEKYNVKYFTGRHVPQVEGKWKTEFEKYHTRSKEFSLDKENEDSSFDSLFLSSYSSYLSGEYFSAKEKIEHLLRKSVGSGSVYHGARLHLLSLGSAASYRLGAYYDAIWFANAGKLLSDSVGEKAGVEYFEEMEWVIETTAGISRTWQKSGVSLISKEIENELGTPMCLENKIERSAAYRKEASLLRDVKIYDAREKKHRIKTTVEEYICNIKRIGSTGKDLSPLMVYAIDGSISFCLVFTEKGKTKISVIKSKIKADEMVCRLHAVKNRNREILKRRCTEREEKEKWWRDRMELDREIGREAALLDAYLRKFQEKGRLFAKQVALVIEDVLSEIPFEICDVFCGKGVFRAPSLGSLVPPPEDSAAAPNAECKSEDRPKSSDPPENSREKNACNVFYLLNPEKNLSDTEIRIKETIREELPNSKGIIARAPEPMEIEKQIAKCDVFMYFGHGGGEKFFTPRTLKRVQMHGGKKKIFLFGCSSAKISALPNYNTHSTCISYLFIPEIESVTGALWDVTDKDLDHISIGVLRSLQSSSEPLSVTINRLRHGCKLKYLNGAAIVVYGEGGGDGDRR